MEKLKSTISYGLFLLKRRLSRFWKQLLLIDKYERIVIVGVMIVLVMILFLPIIILSHHTDTMSKSYLFLFSFSFIKSFILIVGSLVLIILRWLHKRTKLFIVETLWFQGNRYIITFLLWLVVLANFVWIGETVAIIENFTTVVKLTSIFYLIQILLILLIAFSLFMIFSSRHGKFQWRVMWYHTKAKQSDWKDSRTWLFENVHHSQED